MVKCKHCANECVSGKFCSNCGKEIETGTPEPVEEPIEKPVEKPVEKTERDELNEFVESFICKMNIYADLKDGALTYDDIKNIISKCNILFDAKFSKFAPIIISFRKKNNERLWCSYVDLVQEKYRKVMDKNAFSLTFGDNQRCAYWLCISESIEQVGGEFRTLTSSKLNENMHNLKKKGYDEDEILNFVEKMSVGNLLIK